MKSYRYVDGTFEATFEIKKSVFIASIKGEVDETQAEEFVKSIKKKYSDATHNCYAYISDINSNATRFSDDGEPGGTAGQPILEVIKKNKLTKTAIVVTRYFGGIKLGAGGLVGAYTQSAVDGILSSKISEKFESKEIIIKSDYSTFSTLDKLLRKSSCIINNINYGDIVEASVYVKVDDANKLIEQIKESSQGTIKPIELDEIKYVKYDN